MNKSNMFLSSFILANTQIRGDVPDRPDPGVYQQPFY
jgi:hypothetical protein